MFMIWRKAIGWQVDRIIIRTNADRGKTAGNQIMHHGNSLSGKTNWTLRKEQVVINQRWTMGNLYPHVFTKALQHIAYIFFADFKMLR